MRKAIIAAIVATALFAVGAFAANLNVNADDVASGQAGVGACGSAEVIAYETAPDTTDGDFVVTGATVRLTNGEGSCDGAEVDMAIGTDTDEDTTTAESWFDSDDCAASTSTTMTFDYVCAFPSGDQPSVNPIVMVSVLANGNSLPTSSL